MASDRQVVETAEHGLWEIDAQHGTTYARTRLAAMLGTTVEATLGTTPFDFMDAQVAAKILVLKDLGIRVAIDDVGTGYSSFWYPKQLPVDTIKIDQSYINGLGCRREDTAIVHAVVAFAHGLGLRITAEGIETAEQAAARWVLGCDHGQGYYFARPLPADELGARLDTLEADQCG